MEGYAYSAYPCLWFPVILESCTRHTALQRRLESSGLQSAGVILGDAILQRARTHGDL